MNIILNPTKLLYVDKTKLKLNLGNFPETGKSIEISDSALIDFFKAMQEKKSFDEVCALLTELCGVDKTDAMESLNYLLDQNILIDYQDFSKIKRNKRFCREMLYFYMQSEKNLQKNFEVFENAKILILGVGGVGSVVSEMLVRAGARFLTLVDNDVVEESNLIRQLGYFENDIRKSKTLILKKHLQNISSKATINTVDLFVDNESNLDKLIKNVDFVVCTFDKPFRKIRSLVNDVCVRNNKPVTFAGFAEHVGMVGPFVVPHKTACLSCIEKKHAEPISTINMVPSYGPLCGVIGNFVTDEIINYFVKYKSENLVGKTMMINMSNHKIKTIKWAKKEKCKICGGNHAGN